MIQKALFLVFITIFFSNISCFRYTETWINFTNANCVITVAIEGNYIWAGTTGGVVKWNIKDGEYIKFTTADGLVDNVVLSIAIDSLGNRWFGTSEGISRFDDTNWTSYPNDGNNVNSIATDSEGNI